MSFNEYDPLKDFKIIKKCIDIMKDVRNGGNIEQLDYVEENLSAFNMFDISLDGVNNKHMGDHVSEIINAFFKDGGFKKLFIKMPGTINMLLNVEAAVNSIVKR